mmetsp:Transcript_42687/g.91555  ORF Transcript_42687/g.91555 Transcript_42687/m.91555 type:complete len:362 (+) Transcript_42687:58-1143(+)
MTSADELPQEEEGDELEALNPAADKIGAPTEDVGLKASFDIEEGGARALPLNAVPLYQVWPSQNTFFCRGWCMTGGSEECWAPNFCVWTCILVPSSIFFIFVFPQLWHRGAYALPLAVLGVFSMTVFLLCATCCTDPGILPRRSVILATGSAEDLENALGFDILGGVPGQQRGEPELPSHLRHQGYRWCRTCRIVRPPRASHCSDCDNCVLRYDHHCPFVNNCVGQRNYHFFFGFITSVLVLAMLVIPSVLTYISALNVDQTMDHMGSISSAMRIALYGLALGGVLVVAAAFLSFILWSYHVFLISTSRTTKEFQKSLPNATEEPTLCAARGRMLFDPWTQVDPDILGPKPASSRPSFFDY